MSDLEDDDIDETESEIEDSADDDEAEEDIDIDDGADIDEDLDDEAGDLRALEDELSQRDQNARSLAIRRAIEQRMEDRRLSRDLDYLDIDKDLED